MACMGCSCSPGIATCPLCSSAREAGVERVVLLSGGSAVASDLDNAISQYMLASEAAIRRSGLAWTILRPFAFMSNAFRWLPQVRAGDVVKLPFARVANAVIDSYDIARVAATALLEDGHDGQAYRLSGPESLLPADQVRVLAAVLGRDLHFEAQSDEEAPPRRDEYEHDGGVRRGVLQLLRRWHAR
jgi:uncharacterized protein YbjT (DUF2867 family)